MITTIQVAHFKQCLKLRCIRNSKGGGRILIRKDIEVPSVILPVPSIFPALSLPESDVDLMFSMILHGFSFCELLQPPTFHCLHPVNGE